MQSVSLELCSIRVANNLTVCASSKSVQIRISTLQRSTVFEVATTQVSEFEVNVMARCSTSTEDEYVCRFDVLMPSMLIIFSLQVMKRGGHDIPKERSAGGRSAWSSVNVGKAM